MARTRRAALGRQSIVRRMLVAVLTCAMVMGQVPSAAFAEGLSADSLFAADALPGDAATDVPAGQAEVSEGREEGHDEAKTADAESGAGHVDALIAAADANTADISISVIGPDANGREVSWASNTTMEVERGLHASDASVLLFKQEGLEADYGEGTYGWYLSTITSPYTGEKLGWDQATGKYWRLFVNGELSQVGAGGVQLNSGDVITWSYSADTLSSPDMPPVIPQPDASRPDWDSAWPGYASGSNTTAPTPTGEAKESWVSQIKDPADWTTNVSDPIYVGDCVYIAAGSKLLQIDAKTGETVHEGTLVAPINSIARMVYVGGRIIVPLANGRLQALTADHLITTWMTPELLPNAQGGAQQSLTTLTLGDGCVYYGTASADWSASYGGFLRCIDLQTGKVIWSQENTTTGYYWSGAALAGSYMVIGDDSGAVIARNAKTGAEVSRVDVGARVRSTVVTSDGGKTLFAVSSDGVLHRLSLSDAGVLSETGKVKFAKSSTCTPTVSGGKIFVGGQSEAYTQVSKWVKAYYGVLAVIDAKTLATTQVSTIDGHEFVGNMNGQATSADIQSAPVVSVQNGETYVYFTANCNPGGVYRYRLGDTDASLIYTPDASHQNYCMASITVGPDGTLYYVNDSGALFAVGSVRSEGGNQGGSGSDHAPSPDKSPAGSPISSAKQPLKDTEKAVTDDKRAEDEASAADTAKTEESASARATSKGSASNAKNMAGAFLAIVLPIAGIAAGTVGLAGIAYWLIRRRR